MKKLVWCFFVCSLSLTARSQWATSGNNIYNTNTGNVGIGTSSPTFPLHLTGSVNDILGITANGGGRGGIYIQNTNAVGFATLIMENNLGGLNSTVGLSVGGSTNSYPNLFGLSPINRGNLVTQGANSLGLGVGTLTAQPLVFGTNNVERMRIDSGGRVGIGTTTPQARLDVNYSGSGTDIFTTFHSPNGGGVNVLELKENNYVGMWRLYGVGGKGLYLYGNFNSNDPGGINLSNMGNAYNNAGTWAAVSINGFSIGNASSSGNFTFNNLSITPTINNTTGTTLVRGLYYNPTLTATAGTLTNVAYENVTGNNLLNSTSGNTIVGQGTDNGNKLQVNGKLWATGLLLPTGAGAGKVLTSDSSGNATWQAASGGGSGWALGGNTVGTIKTIGTVDSNDLPVITKNVERMRITANGGVAIGTTSTQGYALAVNGSAIFTSAWVKPYGNWPDYVFHKDYRLPSLDSVARYIQANSHLPEVPSAETVAKTGIDLGSNQATLLKKIEELTLYLIDQDKTIQEYKEKFKAQEQQAKAQEERIERLEKLVKQ